MLSLRRFLIGLLAVALVAFGATATAPAHAHPAEAAHGVFALHLTDGHHVSDHGHDHDSGLGELADDPIGAPEERGGAEEHAVHVHACPQFAPVQAPVLHDAAANVVPLAWPSLTAAAVLHQSTPPPTTTAHQPLIRTLQACLAGKPSSFATEEMVPCPVHLLRRS